MNVGKFKAQLIQKGKTVLGLSVFLGYSKSTIYRKLTNGDFTCREILGYKQYLDVSWDDIHAIFFSL